MSETYKLVQETIAKLGYKVLEDDGETITVFYQLNVIHIILCLQRQLGVLQRQEKKVVLLWREKQTTEV